VLGNPKPYDVEIWELQNKSGGWFHPLHIHLIDAQIIGRNTTADGKAHPWEGGGKDVFYLGEKLTVTTLEELDANSIDMSCLLIIGSSQTRLGHGGTVWTSRSHDS